MVAPVQKMTALSDNSKFRRKSHSLIPREAAAVVSPEDLAGNIESWLRKVPFFKNPELAFDIELLAPTETKSPWSPNHIDSGALICVSAIHSQFSVIIRMSPTSKVPTEVVATSLPHRAASRSETRIECCTSAFQPLLRLGSMSRAKHSGVCFQVSHKDVCCSTSIYLID